MKKIIAANWKLHKTPKETRDFFAEFCKTTFPKDREIIFFPTAVCLEATSQSIAEKGLRFGLQNIHAEAQGAFTGENSVLSLKALGGTDVLVGHSERRTLFAETDAQIAVKIKMVQSQGLRPLFCIGETLEQRDANKTFAVLEKQILEGLSSVDKSKDVVIAYEPVWAIGTGRVASLEQIKEAHSFIADLLAKKGFPAWPILYGGSVKPETSQEILSVPYVSGLLVGGASLKPEGFCRIACS